MKTKIEWADAVWNVTTGCTKISTGCKNCFAEKMHRRLTAMGQAKYSEPFNVVRFHPGTLDAPLRRRKPTTWFVNSMSDLFHRGVSATQIAAVFGVMAATPRHTYKILTKRPDRMRDWFEWVASRWGGSRNVPQAMFCVGKAVDCGVDPAPLQKGRCAPWPLLNVHPGVSVSNQPDADESLPLLLQTPAAKRFVSYEPALAGADFSPWLGMECTHEDAYVEPETNATICDECGELPELDQIIVGGESGPGARPCNVEWVRSTVKQCRAAGVACFVKQLGAMAYLDPPVAWPGEYLIDDDGRAWPALQHGKGADPSEWPEDLRVRELLR